MKSNLMVSARQLQFERLGSAKRVSSAPVELTLRSSLAAAGALCFIVTIINGRSRPHSMNRACWSFLRHLAAPPLLLLRSAAPAG